jgi:putative transposase
MAQLQRVVAVGCPHHITQRGNFRRDVFFDEEDRSTYLQLLAHYSAQAQLAILGFCLMSNHIHLIAVPSRLDSMAIAMRNTHQAYSRWLNIRLHRRGHVWQNRYFSCPLDPAHVAYAMRYVEFNPVRAEMVESVLDYPWSSARTHCGLEAPDVQLELSGWQRFYSEQQWTQVLGLGFRHSGDLDRLRQATQTGRPFGTPDFVAELEEKLERTLRPQKRGRKPKAEPKSSSEQNEVRVVTFGDYDPKRH